MIVQGDQYPLTFTITDGTTEITPEMVKGVKLKFNNVLYQYPDEGLSYDEDAGVWTIQLMQEDSLTIPTTVNGEVQVNFGGSPEVIKTSTIKRFSTRGSIIKELWNGN